jgi:hypothetical protein
MTFEAARRILAERGESQALGRAHPTEYLLSGVIRCGRCGSAYVGTSARGRKGPVSLLRLLHAGPLGD